jgi:hypothetical protein
MKLQPKQARFVTEYLIDLNCTKAALRAGYSPRSARFSLDDPGPRVGRDLDLPVVLVPVGRAALFALSAQSQQMAPLARATATASAMSMAIRPNRSLRGSWPRQSAHAIRRLSLQAEIFTRFHGFSHEDTGRMRQHYQRRPTGPTAVSDVTSNTGA